MQGALPTRQTLKPGAPLSDRAKQSILKTSKYRIAKGVPDAIIQVEQLSCWGLAAYVCPAGPCIHAHAAHAT